SVVGVGAVQPEDQEEDDRQGEGEDHRAPVPEQSADLQPQHRRVEAAERRQRAFIQRWLDCLGAHAVAPAAMPACSPSPVSARNASSIPRAVISRSLAAVWVSRYLATAS